MGVRILVGDVRAMLETLPDESVHCVVTSPPYWGLRDYGVEGQIGLEPTPGEFVATMTDVFREVRRVLRADGTCWVNMGDSYAAQRGGTHQPAETLAGGVGGKTAEGSNVNRSRHDGYNPTRNASAIGLKHKDLVGMPWRLAFALQADGWWLRQDIIWSKPNPMPESVRDRCTKAHEYIFLLTKSERYWYDAEAISEEASENTHARRPVPAGLATGGGEHSAVAHQTERNHRKVRKLAEPGSGTKNNTSFEEAMSGLVDRRNKRSVWTITTKGFSEAHFATFPPELPEICIKAGCPPGGTVLDPFFGAGTTGLVANRLGRDCIGIELNPAYADMARRRILGDAPLLAEVA